MKDSYSYNYTGSYLGSLKLACECSRFIPCQITPPPPSPNWKCKPAPFPLQIGSYLVYGVTVAEKAENSSLIVIGPNILVLQLAIFWQFFTKWVCPPMFKWLYFPNWWAKYIDIGVCGKLISKEIQICYTLFLMLEKIEMWWPLDFLFDV